MKKSLLKKTTALTVTVAMLLSLGACDFLDKSKDEVLEAADDAADAIASCDTDGIIDMAYDLDEDDEDELTDEFVFDDETKQAVVDAIADTITYEIDEESVEATKKSGKGSVDVTFTMVDYEAVYEDDECNTDLDTFVAALGDSEETKDVDVTLEFELDDEDWLLSNVSDIQDVYEFTDFEASFAPALAECVDSTTWWNALSEEDGVGYYENETDCLELDILSNDTEVEWNFYYEVYNDGGTNLIYTSDMMTDAGTYIEAYFFTSDAEDAGLTLVNGCIPADTYEITFYDEAGNVLASGSCVVSVEAEETEETEDSEGGVSSSDQTIQFMENDGATDFYDTLEAMSWYDNENDGPVDGGVFSASSFDTIEMTVKMPDGHESDSIAYRYYYSEDGDVETATLVYSATINPTEYTGGLFYDIDYTASPLQVGTYYLVVGATDEGFDSDTLYDISTDGCYFLAIATVTE